jgi:hypothetical protein
MGGSSPKGKLGENAPTFSSSAIPDANETLACQSKAIRGNKTKNKTVFASRSLDRDTRIDGWSTGARQMLKTGAGFLIGHTNGFGGINAAKLA